MENNKLNIASLLGASILLKQMLEQDLLTHDEADAVMRKMVKDNGFSEIKQAFLIRHIHGENYYLREAPGDRDKS